MKAETKGYFDEHVGWLIDAAIARKDRQRRDIESWAQLRKDREPAQERMDHE